MEGSEIIAKCGAAPVGSYAVYAAGGSILIKDCNLQARAGKANHSIGIYSYNSDITISGGEVVAASSPGAGSSSYGIYTYVGSISITDANVGGAAYGATEYCKGIYAGESISIINSEVLGATSTSENTPEYSDGIEAFNGSITIQNSKVRGAAGPGVYESIGIYAFTGIEILGESEIIAQSRDAADETIGCSAGILCFSSITIDGDCVVAAMGLKGFESYGIAAYDWEEESGSASLNILGGSVLALSQNSETGVGIYTSTLNISENANAVAAVGLDRAVYGTVKNALAGTGWDNVDGDGDGEAIPVNTEGAELPAYKSVRFEKAAAPLENPFDDVTESDYFYEPVLWAVNHEPQITNGTDPGKFSPNAKCTRGQVVTFLWRAKGCPEPTATENPFSDVKDSEYYYKAVLWAVENEITTGTGNGKFSPNQGCTRGQVVTFLWRTEGKPEPAATENPFNDVKDSDYFYTAVLWAVENGITQGTDPGKFSPNATCTRGQIVTFLYRDLAA